MINHDTIKNEDENSELLKQLLECVRCGKCRTICPISVLDDLQEISTPRARVRMAYGLLTGAIQPTQTLIDKIYSCFYCGICHQTCPSDVNPSNLVLKTREHLLKLGVSHSNIKNLVNTILTYKNIYGLDQEDRLGWSFDVEDLVSNKININADIGFFVGCTASFKGALAAQPESIVKILDQLKINFTVIGKDEMCCGNPYFLGGGEINDEIKAIITNNIEKFQQLNIKTLITGCPGCYRVIHSIYPLIIQKPLPFEVVHVSQYFSNLINANILTLKKPIKKKLTYQDPCELARHCNIYDEPRNIIKHIPELEFFELSPSRENALCCGGGGLVKAIFPELVDAHLSIKSQQISTCNNQLDGIITTCPSCSDNLTHLKSTLNDKLEVIDLCELILNAL